MGVNQEMVGISKVSKAQVEGIATMRKIGQHTRNCV